MRRGWCPAGRIEWDEGNWGKSPDRQGHFRLIKKADLPFKTKYKKITCTGPT
jgi:hypothetical protein